MTASRHSVTGFPCLPPAAASMAHSLFSLRQAAHSLLQRPFLRRWLLTPRLIVGAGPAMALFTTALLLGALVVLAVSLDDKPQDPPPPPPSDKGTKIDAKEPMEKSRRGTELPPPPPPKEEPKKK